MTLYSAALYLLVVPLAVYILRRQRRRSRLARVPPASECVLILGASSGVGRSLAIQYAQRGARVCIVARGRDALSAVQQECNSAAAGRETTVAVVADFSSPEDMVALRERLARDWGKLDTLAIVAGVSSLKPLLATAGVEQESGKLLVDADLSGVRASARIAGAAVQGNFTGPYIAAVTFIPFLSRTSPSPSVLLLSSVAALIPAPTRALYAATKSASLLLYQALAIEHPGVAFTFLLPGTIEGDFRRSAVDGGTTREADPNKNGLKREIVAQRCIKALDGQEKTVFMGEYFRCGHLLYWIWPSFVESRARVKYNYRM